MGSDNLLAVEPPKDSNGEVIPLDTEVLYTPDGKTLHGICIKYLTKSKRWDVYGYFEGGLGFWEGCTDKLLLATPDSWEKLEEDAMKHSCEYFGVGLGNASCGDCPHGSRRTGRACWANAGLDMIARAKKLAGVEERGGRMDD